MALTQSFDLPAAKPSMDLFCLGLLYYSILTDGQALLCSGGLQAGEALRILSTDASAFAQTVAARLKEVVPPFDDLLANLLNSKPRERRTTEQLMHALRVLYPELPISRHGSIQL